MKDNKLYRAEKVKKPCGRYTVLMIISAVIYLAINIYLIGRLSRTVNIEKSAERTAAIAVFLTIELILLGFTFNAVATIFGAIGLVLTLIRRNKGEKVAQIVLFALLTALPIVTEAVLIFIVTVIF